MNKYIALLRGINVGGNNKIAMKELKALFERNGFTAVSTYINSGNIIFSRNESNKAKLKTECESLIEGEFHFHVTVTIISAKDLTAALDHAPAWWDADEKSKHNAIFVIPPITVAAVFEQVGAIKPEYEKVDYYGQLIFWSAPLATFSKTRWSKVVGSAVYDSITIRNANTVKKLVELTR